ncbi:MAG: S1 RNA-binding domain-containing protein [Aeromicrobium sp.]
MTTSRSNPTNVVVVDGSNIATEGRSLPSLAQLNDAVMAFTEEYPDAVVTVVVDATFGHRIDKKESAEFDLAVAHNELVAPPAGAIGRGDAFVLSIANKVGARILSNDSFQEFHGDYPWLFDEGRLIGGKPVPYVGWVFVERLPVKGPISRKSQRAARGGSGGSGGSGRGEPKAVRRSASREASQPMPVPTAPPPVLRRAAEDEPAPDLADATSGASPAAPAPVSGAPVNDLLPFLDFVEHHPIGSSVNGVVDSYSSHGAYVMVGDLRGYVPLRLMSDPPPRSAREVMHIGDAVTLVVVSFAAARRSVDMAVPAMAPDAEVVPSPELDELVEAVAPVRRAKRGAKKAAAAAEAATAAATNAARAVETIAAVAAATATPVTAADAASAMTVAAAATAAANANPATPPARTKNSKAWATTSPHFCSARSALGKRPDKTGH